MDFFELDRAIAPPDESAMRASRARWDSIAKPLGSLGLLEDAVVKIAGLIGSADIDIKKRAVVVMCADNGVVSEGVTQTGREVTALVAENMAKGFASVCRMAAVAGAGVIPVDIGMAGKAEGVLDMSVMPGTENMAVCPAMTKKQAIAAVSAGIGLARSLRDEGYGLIATGEMGIGNTTSSAAVASVLLGIPAADAAGRGAGLSDEGFERKRGVIARAIALNAPDSGDALDVLAKVGGLDIAGLAGVFIGGALHRVPILADGFISAVAALIAKKLCPKSSCAMLATHASAEPAARLVLDALGLKPFIFADMRLGEGTGAVCAIPMLDMALAVYGEMPTFSDIGIEEYRERVI